MRSNHPFAVRRTPVSGGFPSSLLSLSLPLSLSSRAGLLSLVMVLLLVLLLMTMTMPMMVLAHRQRTTNASSLAQGRGPRKRPAGRSPAAPLASANPNSNPKATDLAASVAEGGTPLAGENHDEDSGHRANNYDVYIVLTPSGNSIGRAIVEEVAGRLSSPPFFQNHNANANARAADSGENESDQETEACFSFGETSPQSLARGGDRHNDKHDTENSKSKSNNTNRAGALKSPAVATTTTTMNFVCLVRCPPAGDGNPGAIGRKQSFSSSANTNTHDLGDHDSPCCTVIDDDDGMCFDPLGSGPAIRTSAEACLRRIVRAVSSRVGDNRGERNESSAVERRNRGRAGSASPTKPETSSRVRIRGIVFNPYGCCPQEQKQAHSQAQDHNDSRTGGGTDRYGSEQRATSSLAEYKLLSIAIFLDAALSMRTTAIHSVVSGRRDKNLEDDEIDKHPKHKGKQNHGTSGGRASLRAIVVGTEAARGLPRMGIPVPDLNDDVDDFSIRNRMLRNRQRHNHRSHSTGGAPSPWERDYAEMNAMAVLYVKALAAQWNSSRSHETGGHGADLGDCYVGTVSPGMTDESLDAAHVPASGRTLALRCKLWCCRIPLVFHWLKAMEIAKDSAEGAALLVDALLNGPIERGNGGGGTAASVAAATGGSRGCLSWDDAYPSGSFVGARSGTGGPLCEQSLLVYNATSGRVGLSCGGDDGREERRPAAESPIAGRTNFLGNPRLQESVYRVVREFVSLAKNETTSC